MGLLDDEALTKGLRDLAWDREGDTLVKVIRKADFAQAMVVVNQVAALAEEANHHPDIDIRWNTVTLRLSTHSAGGLTELDLALAGRIDAAMAVAAGGAA
jgi:4a-hydroxytetrahydrobiopterin dehydratase